MVDEKTLQDTAIEARRLYNRAWRLKNPDKVRMHNQNYWLKRARKLLAEKGASENVSSN